MLMGKVTVLTPSSSKVIVNLNNRARHLVKEWYLMATYLHRIFKNHKTNLTVFRGVKNMTPYRNHQQPIPFSCCMKFSTAMEWIIPETENSFVMIIEVPRDTIYTFIGNMAEGNEVILPAGALILRTKSKIKEVNVVYYTFYQFNYGLQ